MDLTEISMLLEYKIVHCSNQLKFIIYLTTLLVEIFQTFFIFCKAQGNQTFFTDNLWIFFAFRVFATVLFSGPRRSMLKSVKANFFHRKHLGWSFFILDLTWSFASESTDCGLPRITTLSFITCYLFVFSDNSWNVNSIRGSYKFFGCSTITVF